MAVVAVSLDWILCDECSAIWSWSSILSSSTRQLCNRPFEDGAVPKHHHVSITLPSNGPHQTRQMKFIVDCLIHVELIFGIGPQPTLHHFVPFSLQLTIVWCWYETASAQVELKGGSFTLLQFLQQCNTGDDWRYNGI